MLKRIGIGCAGFLAVIMIGVVGLIYVYGPTYGTNFVGKPVFVGTPSPKRYVESVLYVADHKAIHRDSPDYAAAREAALDAAADATNYEDIYAPLDAALKAAGGKHSGITTPAQLADNKQSSPPEMPTVKTEGTIAVATVPAVSAFDGSGQTYADTLASGLADALDSGACAAVVDLRGNTGGDMGPMIAGLSPLIPDGVVMEFDGGNGQASPVSLAGGTAQGGGSTVTVKQSTKHEVPIAVLTDEMTASSGEAVLVSFAGLENVRTFGHATAGYASGNHAFEMPDGAQVQITTLKFRDRTGHVYDEAPIGPDEETHDPLGSATTWLATQCAS